MERNICAESRDRLQQGALDDECSDRALMVRVVDAAMSRRTQETGRRTLGVVERSNEQTLRRDS